METIPFSVSGRAVGFSPVGTFIDLGMIDGREALRVVKDPAVQAVDEPTYAKLPDAGFQDGTIEVAVMSRLLPDAPDYARGFIGVAFRIGEEDERFEGIYLRPTNGRCGDPVRRNRAIQYFSYPGYKFDRLRAECPGVYEGAADIGLDEWITMRIVVSGGGARLYLNGAERPSLVVDDLKHGAGTAGGIGLWVDIGTEGYFADLRLHAILRERSPS
jgi:hypothetical protein